MPWACDSAAVVDSHIEAGLHNRLHADHPGGLPWGLRSTRAITLARSSQSLLVGTLADIVSTSHHRPMFGWDAKTGRTSNRADNFTGRGDSVKQPIEKPG